jgi:hypothetical protein
MEPEFFNGLLLGAQGNKIQEDRLRHFLEEISARLEKLENQAELEPSEELFDLMVKSFDSVIKTRSERKRQRFSNILSKQVSEKHEWEEAESANRLLTDLTDLHIQILEEAINTTPCSEPFENLRVISFNSAPFGSDKESPPKIITNALSQYSAVALKMACSELMSRGLLYDEGVGRLSTKAMEYLAPTDMADWFMAWIKD